MDTVQIGVGNLIAVVCWLRLRVRLSMELFGRRR